MALPDIVRFQGSDNGAFSLYFARITGTTYQLTGGSTAANGSVNTVDLIVDTELVKSGSNWVLTVNDGSTTDCSFTMAATADGGFSTTAGAWTPTGGTLTTITSILDAAATVETNKSGIRTTVTMFGVTGTYAPTLAGSPISYSITEKVNA